MFYHCINLKSLDFINFDTSNVTNMNSMFEGCNNLNRLINIKFDISKVTSMVKTFGDLQSLESLDLTNLKSSNNSINMNSMFCNSNKLNKLIFPETSIKSNNMKCMFCKCEMLKNLDLTNFDTSLVTDMNKMFYYCIRLVSINITSFKTSSVKNMAGMFKCCHSLTSIDLSNFDVYQVTTFYNMFEHCKRLNYINIYNFKSSLIYLDYKNMFYRTVRDVKYCLKENNLEVDNHDEGNCSVHCYKYDELNYFVINNYTNCYEKCLYYFYFDTKTNKYYCTNRYECPEEYNKLDTDNKQCIKGCNITSIYKYQFKKECYSECPNNTELSPNNDYYCNVKCPKQYPFEMVNTQECVSNCSINDRKIKLCIINYVNKEKESSNIGEESINNIREELTSDFDASDIDEEGDIVIEEKGIKYTITSTENQKDGEKNKNSTTINLGECETKLKEHYNIPFNKSLYILKVDVFQEGMKIPKVEYEVYYNLNGLNLVKLDLTVCENMKIDISLPVSMDEDIDKLNSSSAYYNDICYATTSDSGTDISLSDRQNDFIKNNKTLCEENCQFSKYNHEMGKATCSCNIKTNIPLVSDIEIDKTKIFKDLIDINNIINYKIMKCYNNLFNIKKIKNIYGSLILLPIILFHFFCLFYACAKSNKELKDLISYILKAKEIFIFVKNEYFEFKRKNNKEFKNKIINLKQNKDNQKDIEDEKSIHNKIKINNTNFKKPKRKRKKKNKGSCELKYDKSSIPIILDKKSSKKDLLKDIDKNHSKTKISSLKTENFAKIENLNQHFGIFMPKTMNGVSAKKLFSEASIKYEKLKIILKPNENEVNSFPYKLALKYDKRKYCAYYYSLLKTKHCLFSSFCQIDDYNIRIIKIDLFFIDISLNFTVNALFFNDSTMHQIYEDQGNFNLNYQIPQIIYSALISNLFSSIIKLTALTEDNILDIKHTDRKVTLEIVKHKIYKVLKIKFILFCIISSIILILFFYYISCFCVIYKNTQIHLIKDSIFSYSLSLLYPFILYLIPGILRIPAINNINNKREIMYNFSKFLQYF